MTGPRGKIVFLDDEAPLCEAASDWLEASGFQVRAFTDPRLALDQIDAADTDCVVTDMRMPGLSGQEVLDALRALDPELPVILLSGHADVAIAVQSMRTGAHDFLEKPYRAEHLVEVLDRAIDVRRLRRQVRAAQVSAGRSERLESRLIGRSAAIRHLREVVLALADMPVDVLLVGEMGSGKRELAQCLRDFGRRGRRPLVTQPCAGWSEPALEALLFGVDAGQGAGPKSGKLEQAQGGTLVLSEIDALPMSLQARLLRALLEGAVERTGRASAPRPVDVRLIATTEVDLAARVREGRFRADLFHHLSVAVVEMPPLRARREDVALLYAHFAAAAAERFNRPPPVFAPGDLDRLAAADWPGNLPELRASAERAVLALPLPGRAPPPLPLPERLAQVESQMIAEALAACGGASAAAAERLGIPRRTLNEKIARYGLRSD